jgi:mannose-6-phosphate isomerase-like protein (cupin superfamily)
MGIHPLTVIDIQQQTKDNTTGYANIPLTVVNDHVIKVSVMTQPFYWHLHPNSDETFMVTEGSVFIDLEEKTVELIPGQLFTIPKNTKHRTRPGNGRSVNITIERVDMETVRTGD